MLIILSCCTLHPQWLSYNWKFVPFDCLHSNFPSSMPLLLVTTKLICFFHKFHLKYNWPITLLLPILYNTVIWSFYTFQNDDHNTRLLCSWDSPGKKLEWAAISFSRGTSQPRNWTQVSRIAGRCLTDWATWEALLNILLHNQKHATDKNCPLSPGSSSFLAGRCWIHIASFLLHLIMDLGFSCWPPTDSPLLHPAAPLHSVF